jgi:protein ImuB
VASPRAGLAVEIPADDRPIALSVPLAGATTLSEIAFALPSTLGQLVSELAARDLAAVRLRILLRMERTSGGTGMVQVPVRSGRPTRDPIRLGRLVQSRLEAVRLTAPINELVIEVAESAPSLGWQPGLIDRTEATESLPELLARLTDTLGEAAVFAPGLADRWRPESSWVPRLFPPPPTIRAMTGGGFRLVDDPVEAQDQWTRTAARRPRPSLLLPIPERVDVRLGGGELPIAVRLGDTWVAVARIDGPERLVGEWWRIAETLDREYWTASLGASAAWLFRDRSRWYLHGWFD